MLKLPTDILQFVQTFFILAKRSVLPLVCRTFRNVVPLVPSEKKQFDALVSLHETSLVQSLLGLSIVRDDAKGVALLVKLGADRNAPRYFNDGTFTLTGNFYTAVYLAVKKGSVSTLAELLGADPDQCPAWQGNSLLTVACENSRLETVKYLLSRGTDPNHANRYGDTPCSIASMNGDVECLRVLAEGAAGQGISLDVDSKNNTGDAPILRACRENNHEVVRWLLDHDADPNCTQDQMGEKTPLMYAAGFGNMECIRALDKGSERNDRSLDVNAMCTCMPWLGDLDIGEGKTALDYTPAHFREVVAYLNKIGAVTGEEVHALSCSSRKLSAT